MPNTLKWDGQDVKALEEAGSEEQGLANLRAACLLPSTPALALWRLKTLGLGLA